MSSDDDSDKSIHGSGDEGDNTPNPEDTCTTIALDLAPYVARSDHESSLPPVFTDESGKPTNEMYKMSYGEVKPFHFRNVKFAGPDMPEPQDMQHLKQAMRGHAANLARITEGGDMSHKTIEALERRVAKMESNSKDVIAELSLQVHRLTKLSKSKGGTARTPKTPFWFCGGDDADSD